MFSLTREDIDKALPYVKEGLEKYAVLQQNFMKNDIRLDSDFQRRFNHFYKVRRNSDWRELFYDLLENKKKSGTTFKESFEFFLEVTGRFEASFMSKLVATIHPEKPVIDKFVLKNVDLILPSRSDINRKNKIIKIYDQLDERLNLFLQTDNGKYLVKEFQTKYPKADVSEIKMLDLVLWQKRPD